MLPSTKSNALESHSNTMNISIGAARVIERNGRSITVAALMDQTVYFGVGSYAPGCYWDTAIPDIGRVP